MPNCTNGSPSRLSSARRTRAADEHFDDLVVRFKQRLSSQHFVCVRCVAAQIGADSKVLADAVLLPLWIGYSFATAHCNQCGEDAYCALSTETEPVYSS